MIGIFYREIISDPTDIIATAEKVAAELGTATHRLINFAPGVTPRVGLYSASGDRMISLLARRGSEFGITEGLKDGDKEVEVATTLFGYGFPNGRTRHNSSSAPNIQLKQSREINESVMPETLARGLKRMNRSAMKTGIRQEDFTPSEIVGQRQFEGIRLLQYSRRGSHGLTTDGVKEAIEGLATPRIVLGRVEFEVVEESDPDLYGFIR